MNTCLETEILYQISLVIGSSTELGPMLQRTARTLLRLLNGTSCAILRATPAAHDGQPAEAACLLPRHPLANPSFHAFLLYGSGLAEQPTAPQVREIGDTHFHFYHLPGFGTLVFGRQGEALSQTLQLAFLPLAEKLAQAAVAKIVMTAKDFYTGPDSVVSQLRELSERPLIEGVAAATAAIDALRFFTNTAHGYNINPAIHFLNQP